MIGLNDSGGAAPGPAAFYALGRHGWRAGVTLLHLPYTAWHLSYFALGCAAADHIYGNRLGWGLLALFLAVGIAAHGLDELQGRPLGTTLDASLLISASAIALIGAGAIGIVGAVTITTWLVPLVALGVALVLAYSLELFGGRFHGMVTFALAGGAFPAFTGYFANATRVTGQGLLIAAACAAMCTAQRRLSIPARDLRRRTRAFHAVQERRDGTVRELSADDVREPLESALKAWTVALVLASTALVMARL